MHIITALNAIHSLANKDEKCGKVVHRDLKPENFIFRNGSVYLIDFGTLKETSEQDMLNSDGTISFAGTPKWSAPEGIIPKRYENGKWIRVYDESADLFSMGLVLFWLLTYSKSYNFLNCQIEIAKYFGQSYDENTSTNWGKVGGLTPKESKRLNNALEILFSKINGNKDIEKVRTGFYTLIASLLEAHPKNRPDGMKVVEDLKNILDIYLKYMGKETMDFILDSISTKTDEDFIVKIQGYPEWLTKKREDWLKISLNNEPFDKVEFDHEQKLITASKKILPEMQGICEVKVVFCVEKVETIIYSKDIEVNLIKCEACGEKSKNANPLFFCPQCGGSFNLDVHKSINIKAYEKQRQESINIIRSNFDEKTFLPQSQEKAPNSSEIPHKPQILQSEEKLSNTHAIQHKSQIPQSQQKPSNSHKAQHKSIIWFSIIALILCIGLTVSMLFKQNTKLNKYEKMVVEQPDIITENKNDIKKQRDTIENYINEINQQEYNLNENTNILNTLTQTFNKDKIAVEKQNKQITEYENILITQAKTKENNKTKTNELNKNIKNNNTILENNEIVVKNNEKTIGTQQKKIETYTNNIKQQQQEIDDNKIAIKNQQEIVTVNKDELSKQNDLLENKKKELEKQNNKKMFLKEQVISINNNELLTKQEISNISKQETYLKLKNKIKKLEKQYNAINLGWIFSLKAIFSKKAYEKRRLPVIMTWPDQWKPNQHISVNILDKNGEISNKYLEKEIIETYAPEPYNSPNVFVILYSLGYEGYYVVYGKFDIIRSSLPQLIIDKAYGKSTYLETLSLMSPPFIYYKDGIDALRRTGMPENKIKAALKQCKKLKYKS